MANSELSITIYVTYPVHQTFTEQVKVDMPSPELPSYSYTAVLTDGGQWRAPFQVADIGMQTVEQLIDRHFLRLLRGLQLAECLPMLIRPNKVFESIVSVFTRLGYQLITNFTTTSFLQIGIILTTKYLETR